MGKGILDTNPRNVDHLLDRYTSLLDLKRDDVHVRRLIIADSVYRIVTDTIADQQNPAFHRVAKQHLEKNRIFLEEVVFNCKH